MAFKIKVGCRILKILVVGYGMKLSLRDRDSFLFIGEMWDIYLKAGCRMTQIKMCPEQTCTFPDRIWD